MNTMNLDFRTYLYFSGLTGLVLAMASFAFTRILQDKIKGLNDWTASLFSFGVSFIFFSLRTWDLPFLSHYLANVLIHLGTSWALIAMLKFHGKNFWRIPVYVISFFVCIVLSIDFGFYGDQTSTLRALTVLIPSSTNLLLTGFLFVTIPKNRRSFLSHISAFSYFLLATVLILRIIRIFLGSPETSIYNVPPLYQFLFLGVTSFSLLLSNLSYLLMTVQKINSDLLKKTAQAQFSGRMASLGEMAAGIAHEINNPLTVIQIQVERVKSLLDNEPPESSAIEALKKTELNVLRVSQIIRGLLEFSKEGDAGLIPTNLEEVINATLQLCREKIRLKYIDLKIQKIPNEKVICYPPHISQILLSLINNAIDSIESTAQKDPQRHRTIEISFESQSQNLSILVSNSGDVIDKNLREKIFEPFFTTKEIGEGIGLGLSIAHGLAEKNRGQLTLSDSEVITTFRLSLEKFTSDENFIKSNL